MWLIDSPSLHLFSVTSDRMTELTSMIRFLVQHCLERHMNHVLRLFSLHLSIFSSKISKNSYRLHITRLPITIQNLFKFYTHDMNCLPLYKQSSYSQPTQKQTHSVMSSPYKIPKIWIFLSMLRKWHYNSGIQLNMKTIPLIWCKTTN